MKTAEKKTEKSIKAMYKLLSQAYKGNWQKRWQDVPFFKQASEEGKIESIIGHTWATMEFWFILRRICPKLDSLVDSLEIYEILLNHDLGETDKGDVPLYQKIKGVIDDKIAERQGIEKLTEELPKIKRELLDWFDEFEAEVKKIEKLEILIARWIDNLQGNHFALIFGKRLPQFSQEINSILQIRFVPYTNRLIQVLEEREEKEAIKEVKQIARYHAKLVKAAGINLDMSRLRI